MALAPVDSPDALPLYPVAPATLDEVLATLPDTVATWARAAGYRAGAGEVLTCPGETGAPVAALVGLGAPEARARHRFLIGAAATALPPGDWRLVADGPEPLTPGAAAEATLGWLLQLYRFDRFKSGAEDRPVARLVPPASVDRARIETIAAGECLTRDLINTPANLMGPDELEAAARRLADAHGAGIRVIAGDDLLEQNLPLIHAVGRASPRTPRLIELTAGSDGPRLTLVGKGVCFDTGGLNLKPGNSMALMKKDMGGAATVLGLASMILATGLPLRLRVLIPAVENAVSGSAFRPGDVLTSRSGRTVEVNNTDAEGRLVLADALTLATEEETDLLVSMATLTGAARVAVGPDLAPFYTDDEALAAALAQAGRRVADPLWRLPFHAPYEAMIEPAVADLDNAPSGGMAGSITAALFLRRFAGAARYLHYDIYGWQPSPAPGRPKGGVGQGARALFEALPDALGL